VEKIPILQTHKPPFKITIRPRSEKHAELIRRTCAYAASPDAEVSSIQGSSDVLIAG